jgi:hypothetical protein
MSENVTIINTAANPVPITLSAQTPNGSGGKNVTVLNTSANPVNVVLV